ncbi:hypothetical protein IWX50DRAFT_617202 [Phyllosticta citricarpa]|uniref:Secreted protein n=1 Tax=Phyllosticta citricarpa TaxID=55181 RepID=A0ABR1MFH6_9PEZI
MLRLLLLLLLLLHKSCCETFAFADMSRRPLNKTSAFRRYVAATPSLAPEMEYMHSASASASAWLTHPLAKQSKVSKQACQNVRGPTGQDTRCGGCTVDADGLLQRSAVSCSTNIQVCDKKGKGKREKEKEKEKCSRKSIHQMRAAASWAEEENGVKCVLGD